MTSDHPAFHDHFTNALLASSRSQEMARLTIDLLHVPAGARGVMPAFDFHTVSIITKGSCEAEACLGGVNHRGLMRAGSVSVVPAGTSSSFSCDRDNDVALVSISPDLLDETASELDITFRAEKDLAVLFNSRNDTIDYLSRVLVSQLFGPEHPAQRLIYDSTSQAFAAELLRTSGHARSDVPHVLSGLPARTLAKVLEYIDDHLSAPIGLSDLALVANVSRFHFLKLFKLSTGVTPMAYVEGTRLKRSEELIRAGHMELTEIALAVGFADQSHFTRRFRRHAGLTPGEFRRERGRRLVPGN